MLREKRVVIFNRASWQMLFFFFFFNKGTKYAVVEIEVVQLLSRV